MKGENKMYFKKIFFSLFLMLFVFLSACGKRGFLEYPDNARPTMAYPKPQNPSPRQQKAQSADPQDPIQNNPAMQMNILQGLDMPDATQDVVDFDDSF